MGAQARRAVGWHGSHCSLRCGLRLPQRGADELTEDPSQPYGSKESPARESFSVGQAGDVRGGLVQELRRWRNLRSKAEREGPSMDAPTDQTVERRKRAGRNARARLRAVSESSRSPRCFPGMGIKGGGQVAGCGARGVSESAVARCLWLSTLGTLNHRQWHCPRV